METRLKKLFDYQRYAGHPRLGALIEDTQRRCVSAACVLEDEKLEIHAAGDPSLFVPPKETPDGKC